MGIELGQAVQFEYILGRMSVGVAILDASGFRIRYVNHYLRSLLEKPWNYQDVSGRFVEEVVPGELSHVLLPILKQVAATGQSAHYPCVPYEGFLEARGRTYWKIVIEHFASQVQVVPFNIYDLENTLLVRVEDVTDTERSRLHLNAINSVSSAIAGPFSLPEVLDRILQAVHEMVGSTRCAVTLIEQSLMDHEVRTFDSSLPSTQEKPQHQASIARTALIAAQRGLHLRSQDWHPLVNEQVLLGRVIRERRTLIITDTRTTPDLELPSLDDAGEPGQPGSVLCVPIFEPPPPYPAQNKQLAPMQDEQETTSVEAAVLGTIEVYHRRARGFPREEVQLLEQFAQQVGLAIQNARLFHLIYHDVTEQAAARERIEAEVIARTKELAQRNKALQRAQKAQAMERARLELLLERLPFGVVLVSHEDSRINLINRRAVELLQDAGLLLEPLDDPDEARQRAIGKDSEALLRSIQAFDPSGKLVPPEEWPLFRALKHGEASEAELHLPARDGQMLYLLTNAAPLRGKDDSITSVVMVFQEITKMKALERAREDFFTTMAHELKTPLANIRAHLSALLAKDLQWSLEEQQKYLQAADEQVERLVDMVNQLLDASRVEAGALRLELEPVLLPEMFEDLQDRLEALITTSRRKLQVTLPSQLPAVLADYELIISVLTNLLSNAFRYAPEGDIVQLSAELVTPIQDRQLTPTGVTFSVTDRGPGMTQEQQKALFTRFSTLAAMSRPAMDRPGQPLFESSESIEDTRGTLRWSRATGLGLYISRGIVEAHGAKLMVVSSPGQGATFSFTLPVFTGKSGVTLPMV